MNLPPLKKATLWLCLALLGLTYWLCFERFENISENEPDRYFYLALGKATASHGILKHVPQAEGLGWGETFYDKNFLFTYLISIAFQLGGESAALNLVPIFALGLIGFLFVGAWKTLGTLPALLITMSLCFLTPDFLNRLILLRPHLLAIPLMVGLLWGIIHKRWWLSLCCCVLFSLSYHAFYLPLMILGLSFLLSFRKDRLRMKLIASAAIALCVGIIINPYFPLNVDTGVRSFRIAVNSANLPLLERPIDAIAMSHLEYFKRYGGIVVAILTLAGLCLWQNRTRLKLDFWLPLACALTLWIATSISPRGIEYAIPFSFVFLVYALKYAPNMKVWAIRLSLFLFITQMSLAFGFFTTKGPYMRQKQHVTRAVQEIESTEKDQRLFNCEWSYTPFVFYQRPDLKFIDISDPYLLYDGAPAMYYVRNKLKFGLIAYPFGLLRRGLKMDYVLCAHPIVVEQLESDPHFKRLYPNRISQLIQKSGLPYLYSIAKKTHHNLVIEYEGTILPVKTEEERLHLSPSPNLQWYPFKNRLPYLDLFQFLARYWQQIYGTNPNATFCASIRPTREELHRLEGAQLVAFGGGSNIRVWFNGTPIYNQEQKPKLPRMISQFVVLPRTLQKNDSVEAIVCSHRKSPFMGISLSLWNYQQIGQVCESKGYEPERIRGAQRSCLGPISQPNVSHRS